MLERLGDVERGRSLPSGRFARRRVRHAARYIKQFVCSSSPIADRIFQSDVGFFIRHLYRVAGGGGLA